MDIETIYSRNPAGTRELLKKKSAFVAGAGGLGSNVAMILARSGIRELIVVDFDVIQASNLNRQHYFIDQIGQAKASVLKETLLRINPELEVETFQERLSNDNFDAMIPSDVDIIFECFDCPKAKADLTRFCLVERRETPLIAVSGISGVGDFGDVTVKKGTGNIWIVGDNASDSERDGTFAAKVLMVASIQAYVGLKSLMWI